MLSRAEARKQREAIARQIAADEKKKARATIARLRADVRSLKLHRKEQLAEIKATCRAHRQATRERIREMRAHALAELKEATREARELARSSCEARKREVRASTADAIAKARALLEEERKYQRDLKRIERDNRLARRSIIKPTAKERRSERDDDVRANISPELVPLWERVKSGIRASSRMSRTEAFLKYVEENPGEAFEAIDASVDAKIAELERQAAQIGRAPRGRRSRVAPAAYSDVPF